MHNQPKQMKSVESFKVEFLCRRNLLREDTRKPESKRNETGNLWKYSLKAALEAEGYTVILEQPHATYKNNKRINDVKSDISVYKNGILIAVIECKDYFTINCIRGACNELSRIIKSYRTQESIEVVGFCFQGRTALKINNELINDELTYYDEDIEMITMIDEKRKSVKGKLQTIVNTDFDVKYDEVNKIVEKLNAIIQ